MTAKWFVLVLIVSSFKLEARAVGGDLDAACCFGYALQQGEGGVDRNLDRAAEFYAKVLAGKQTASESFAFALFNLSLLRLQSGDTDAAAKLLSDSTLAEGFNLLAMLLLQKGDDDAALHLLTKSAHAPCLNAANNMGVLFATGRAGLKKDAKTARKWFGKAVGLDKAAVNLKLLEESEMALAAKKKEERRKRAREYAAKEEEEKGKLVEPPLKRQNGPEPYAVAIATARPQAADATSATAALDLLAIESMARHNMLIYSKMRNSLSKEEFVLCWSEMPLLEDCFANQLVAEAVLGDAFDILAKGANSLGQSDFVAFFLKVFLLF